MGNDYGLNRSGWADVSEGAKQRLEIAKEQFRIFVKQYTFQNVDNNYQFTKKHAIQLHLVGKLRPKFNTYVKEFGGKPKWVKLTENEKRSISKYKNRVSAVYFCNLTIDGNVKQKLMEKEPNAFKSENLIQEISLFTCLTSKGVPELDALGWIVNIPKNQKIEQIPRIGNLKHFLDEKIKNAPKTIGIETTYEYQNDPKRVKKKRTVRKNPTTRALPKLTPVTSYFNKTQKRNNSNNSNNSNNKRNFMDLCESDDEYLPPSQFHKKRRLR